MNKLFVYGTLRPTKLATHEVYNYAMYNYGKFPYIVQHVGAKVSGNLVAVTDEELLTLDRHEGVHKGMYTREQVEVVDVDDEVTTAYIYVATANLHPAQIASGDWFKQ